jgi:hypothetical protein
MEQLETIFVDFNNTDTQQRVRLITSGALNDIKERGIKLYAGLHLLLDDRQEFKVKGTVEFSEEENIWVARVHWEELDS